MKQITELTNQVTLSEQELAHVEFRALVAEAWSRSSGWLSAVDETRLELNRLRLRIAQDKSDEYHTAIRQRLATETLLDLELNDIQGVPEIRTRAVRRIIQAFRLDPEVTEKVIQQNIDIRNIELLINWFDTSRTVWRSEDEYHNIKALFQRLLRSKQNTIVISGPFVEIPGIWKGQYTYSHTLHHIPMVLYIEEVINTSFFGRIEWPTRGNTITKMRGELLYTSPDTSEEHKWEQIADYNLLDNQIKVKFTETDYIQGSSTQKDGIYYALILDNATMIGVWYITPAAIQNDGSFSLNST